MSDKKNKNGGKTNYKAMGANSTFLMIKNLPFISFVVFLMILYIANSHYAEWKMREIQSLQNEVSELNSQFTSLKSDLMHHNLPSEIAEKVRDQGLMELIEKPYKIVVPKQTYDP